MGYSPGFGFTAISTVTGRVISPTGGLSSRRKSCEAITAFRRVAYVAAGVRLSRTSLYGTTAVGGGVADVCMVFICFSFSQTTSGLTEKPQRATAVSGFVYGFSRVIGIRVAVCPTGRQDATMAERRVDVGVLMDFGSATAKHGGPTATTRASFRLTVNGIGKEVKFLYNFFRM